MADIQPLGEFVRNHPRFSFDVLRFVESLRYEPAVRKRFESFCRTFALPSRPDAGWAAARDQVRALVAGVPAYAGLAWDCEHYQDSIPFIDKSVVRASPEAFIAPWPHPDRRWSRETSGTTGPPLRIWYTPEFAFDHMLLGTAKGAWVAGALTPAARAAKVFSLMIVENRYLSDVVSGYPGSLLNLNLQVRFDERRIASAHRIAAVVERYRPAIVGIKPNTLASLLRAARERGWRGAYRPSAVICSGADLDETLRHEAQCFFGTRVYNNYGLTEVGLVAAECARQDGLHIYERTAILEVLGENGTLSSAGIGELVVSGIANRAMPLLRYRTGDLVEVTDEPCACGVPARRIVSLSGRMIPNFRFRDGSEFSPFHFNRLFDRYPIREFRLTQADVEDVLLEVEFLPACPDPAAVLEVIGTEVREEIRGRAAVHATQTKFLMEGKFQRYRSHLGLVPLCGRE